MDNIARLRQVPAHVVRVQRRIWLLQAAFWSLITLSCIAAVIAVTRSMRRQHDATASLQAAAPGSQAAALTNGDGSPAADLRQS